MGSFQRLLEKEFRERQIGTKHTSSWEIIYGDDNLDKKFNAMIDAISKIVGKTPITQILVHKNSCPSCQESLPKFKLLKNVLEKRLENYKGYITELKEKVHEGGKIFNVTGMDIYKYYKNDTKGVPFVIQNAEVIQDGLGRTMKPSNSFIVTYVGKLDPFRFLASTFNIENDYIK